MSIISKEGGASSARVVFILRIKSMLECPNDSLFGGRYKVVKSIGAGGMGAVYLATDPRYRDFEVAIKVLYPGIVKTAELRERFKNEIIASYNVLHRNVVRAYEYFDENDSPAYVMEYVEGTDLHNRINAGAVSPEEAANILYQAAAGLDAIHAAGIMHRDLKPENIFLTKTGLVKIGDFGVARLRSVSASVTQTGMLVGTPKYFAPEYIEFGECDGRGDIYALGVIAYELLTGVSPFRSKTSNSLMLERFTGKVTPISQVTPNCPIALAQVVEKAMATSVMKRYQKAGEMRVDLGLILKGQPPIYAAKNISTNGSNNSRKARVVERLKKNKKPKRNFKKLFLKLFISLVVVGVGAASYWFYFHSGFFNDKIKIARGEYRGFIIDGDRYRNIKVSRRSAGVFISVKELGCQKAPLDENGMIQCNDVKYKFEVEFSKNEAASGTLIEQGNGIKREWKIEKKSH